MIASTSRGGGFRGVLEYVFGPGKSSDEPRAVILGGSLVGRNPQELSAEFGELRRLRPDCKNPVKHIAFALPCGEDLKDSQWLELGRRKAEQEGWDSWVMVRHTDEPQAHVHMVACRITQMGEVIRETGFDVGKTEALCRQVEDEFGLRKVESPLRSKAGKKLPELVQRETKGERRHRDRTGEHSPKDRLQGLLHQVLLDAKSWAAFEAGARRFGIDVRPVQKGGRLTGVSYEMDGFKARGGALGKMFAAQGVLRQIAENQGKRGGQDEIVSGSRKSRRKGHAVRTTDLSWAPGISALAVEVDGCRSLRGSSQHLERGPAQGAGFPRSGRTLVGGAHPSGTDSVQRVREAWLSRGLSSVLRRDRGPALLGGATAAVARSGSDRREVGAGGGVGGRRLPDRARAAAIAAQQEAYWEACQRLGGLAGRLQRFGEGLLVQAQRELPPRAEARPLRGLETGLAEVETGLGALPPPPPLSGGDEGSWKVTTALWGVGEVLEVLASLAKQLRAWLPQVRAALPKGARDQVRGRDL